MRASVGPWGAGRQASDSGRSSPAMRRRGRRQWPCALPEEPLATCISSTLRVCPATWASRSSSLCRTKLTSLSLRRSARGTSPRKPSRNCCLRSTWKRRSNRGSGARLLSDVRVTMAIVMALATIEAGVMISFGQVSRHADMAIRAFIACFGEKVAKTGSIPVRHCDGWVRSYRSVVKVTYARLVLRDRGVGRTHGSVRPLVAGAASLRCRPGCLSHPLPRQAAGDPSPPTG
jgi:hypothetical protein